MKGFVVCCWIAAACSDSSQEMPPVWEGPPPGEETVGPTVPPGLLAGGGLEDVRQLRVTAEGLYVLDREGRRLQYVDGATGTWSLVAKDENMGPHDLGQVVLGPASGRGVFYAVQSSESGVSVSYFDPGQALTRITFVELYQPILSMFRFADRDLVIHRGDRLAYRPDGSSYEVCPDCSDDAFAITPVGDAFFYRDPRGLIRRHAGTETVIVPTPADQIRYSAICGEHLVLERSDLDTQEATWEVLDLDGAVVREVDHDLRGECVRDPDRVLLRTMDGFRTERLSDGKVTVLHPTPGDAYDVVGRTAYVIEQGEVVSFEIPR